MNNFHNNYIPFIILLLILSCPLQADLLQPSTLTAINTEYNNTSWAASNLRDDDPTTRWLSSSSNHTNDINFQLNASGDAYCFDSIDLINYGNDDRSVKQFMLLSSSDVGISGDTSTNAIGWKPVVADDAPSGLINYLTWAQGGRLVSIDSQYNTTSWAAKNSHDGSAFSRWLSKSYQSYNILEYNFDTDWDGSTGNGIPIEEIEITNYGNDDRSIKELQIEVTTDGANWFKLEVPGTLAGDSEYVYTQRQEGGVLGTVNSQYNTTSWGAANIQDGSQLSRWLSKSYQGNNTIEFTFDPDNDGQTGANGDIDDLFTIDKFYLENYGTDDRSIREFQVEVKTLLNPYWSKVTVPGATIGTPGYDFLLSHHGAELVTIDSQYNSTSWGADNIHDGDHMTRWLSKNTQSNNVFEFQFDVNEDGIKNVDDHFTINSFFLQNYGDDDRSIREFQVSVKTVSDPSWQKIKVPGAAIGTTDYNFLLKDQGGFLAAIDSQYNTTSWAAKNINDGSQITRWLSKNQQSRNTLAFTFDVDEDGNTGTASDLFIMESFYLENYGVDDRSIREFQVAVKTLSKPTWQKIKVPGSTIGITDHNFLLADHGGVLAAVDSQYNTTSWAAKNINDGSQMTRWLSLNTQLNNTLDFQFDINEDGTVGGIDDLFTMEKFHLQNYGNDDRSIKEFQIEVKTSSNSNWTKVQVPGTAANDPDYNFVLADHGGGLTLIGSQYNTTSWAAKNIHDGNQISRWLSQNNQFINTLEFSFDTDNNGSTGDTINLDTIELINYGNDDRSIQTFEIDIQISGGAWQPVNAPSGGTIFTANMDRNGQSWSVASQTNVTATRIRTLSNYGDANYIGASEISFSGASIGPSHTFTATMNGSGETFALVAPIVDVTDVRLRTISNHGDPNYVGAAEFKVLGLSTIESSTFVAAMHESGETFTLSTPLVDVTDVKLMTISNHGDPNYVGAREFKVLGPSITKTATFVAAMHGDGETFVLDSDDIPVDVTDVKLTTISNHGDPNYVGAKDFKVLGNSITETKTFVAAMHGDGETFILDSDDVPLNVTDVKLITINNHGDNNYVGAREFEVIGHSVTPAHTFIIPMQTEPYRIALDNDDIVTGVVGARIITIRNHGDPNYIGAADFQLLGTAIGPSYVFEAEMNSSTQHFAFSPLNSNLLRFHTLNNHGDPTYTGASELVLNSSVCPTGQWHMDEASWSGAAGEVLDSSGGEHSGTVFGIGTGLADPNTANSEPAIISNPGTCRYGEFDGIDDYIEIPDSEDFDNTAQITLSAWFNAKSFTQTNGTNARGLFSKRPSFSNNISYGAFFWNGHGNNLYIDIDGSNDRFASNTSFNSDTWYHIAIVYDGTQIASQRVRLYVNGILDGTFTESSSSIPDTTSNFYIGNLYTGLSQLKVFDGSIDEVNVIPEALTESQISSLYAETHNCDSLAVHHYEIEHDGQGLTCDTESVTIKACTDESCENLSNEPIALDFQVTNNTATTTEDSLTFTGSTSINFNHTVAETLILSVANATITATDPVVCNDGSSTSCDITFTNAGFRFFYGDDPTIPLPNQTSGSEFDYTLKLQAVEESNGVCTGIFDDNKDVNLSQENVDPNDTDGLSFTVDGNEIAKHSDITNVTLNFGSNSIATIPKPMYLDAGKIRLHANYNVGGVSLTGSSNAFWVSPAYLAVTAQSAGSNLNGATAAAEPTHNAGEVFALTVSAYNSLHDITPHYQPRNMQFKLTRTGPTSHGFDGFLTYNDAGNYIISVLATASPTFTNVTLNTTLISGAFGSEKAKYSEVGLLNLDIQDNKYAGGIIRSNNSINIGRFKPDHFIQEVVQHGSFLNTCNMGIDYAYLGQKDETDTNIGAIKYLTNPIIKIIARNKAGDITKNYYQGTPDDFMKLDASDIDITAPTQDQDAKGVDGTPLLLTANISSVGGTLSNMNLNAIDEENFGKPLPHGTLHYELSADDHFFYQRSENTLVTPFPAKIHFSLATTTTKDEDGVLFDEIEELQPNGLEIRFARMVLKNSFGPETSNLPQPLQIEHYDEDKVFVITNNNCAGYDIANMSLDPTSPPNVLIDTDTEVLAKLDINPGDFSAGKTNAIMIKAPGAGKQGALKVTYDTFNWLKYDWDADDAHDDNPSATATFGLFRGNDRIIYWREAVN